VVGATDPGGLPGTFPVLVVARSARESMNAHTESPNNSGNDEGVSLTKVDVEYLTDYERREVIPACDFVVIGYDSSYSDKPKSTKRIVEPSHFDKSTSRHGNVRGRIVGEDGDDPDRSIGISGSTIYTSKASGRIGSLLWVAYPAPEPPKTTYDVTFRALAGRWSTRNDDVDDLTERTVDKYSYDDLRAPPEDERRFEDVTVDDGSVPLVNDTQRKVAVDIPRRITVADDAAGRDEAVERARKETGTASLSSYEPDTAEWVDDLAPIGEHVYERDGVGMNDRNLRNAVRYWVEDVDVDVAETHGGEK
jgi:hypothetical protein